MYEIQTNEKGSRHMFINDEHLDTIEQYCLFKDLIDSNGIVTEMVLEKLRLNVRALIESDNKDAGLLNLCKDVLFHENMKAYGLNQLIKLYVNWCANKPDISIEENDQ